MKGDKTTAVRYLTTMNLQDTVRQGSTFQNLELLARQVVEGFISGMHKSPFHGFSAEFAEHKIYNPGESTRHIDWKLFAKTDKLYTKRYDEETNLRCHLILDNSASMHYPAVKQLEVDNLNKLGFSALAIASIMRLMKKQRDAVGLSIYGEDYEYYAPEKGNDRHHAMLLEQLQQRLDGEATTTRTRTPEILHQIAENIHRRSLIFLFTDLFVPGEPYEDLVEALRHLKHNKHEVVLFNIHDGATEMEFDFSNRPTKFVDVETGDTVNLYANNVKEQYKRAVTEYYNAVKEVCIQYRIKYVPVDLRQSLDQVLLTFLIERQKFA